MTVAGAGSLSSSVPSYTELSEFHDKHVMKMKSPEHWLIGMFAFIKCEGQAAFRNMLAALGNASSLLAHLQEGAAVVGAAYTHAVVGRAASTSF